MSNERAENLLLIDGNNMAHRVFWTCKNLSYNGKSVSLLYGFFRSLIGLKKDFPEHFTVIAWDSKSERRMRESKEGVEKGIIPSEYKANRIKSPEEEDVFKEMHEQMGLLRDGLNLAKVLQVRVDGYEADDVLYTYALQNDEAGGETVIVTSDKDYYQLLRPRIKIFDAMNQEMWTEERFIAESGYEPSKWVEAGAICGDKSDNIFGVSGWGQITANKYLIKYGSLAGIKTALQSQEKKSKKEIDFLASADRLQLALSLKQMDRVPCVPRLRTRGPYDRKKIEEFFIGFGFASLIKDTGRLV